MTMDNVKGLTLRLPEPLLIRLTAIARAEGRSANSQIVMVLATFADSYERDAAREGTGVSQPIRVAAAWHRHR